MSSLVEESYWVYRYVGADLSALISESSTVAVNRIIQDLQSNETNQIQSLEDVNNVPLYLTTNEKLPKEKLEQITITMDDFLIAVKKVQPSAKREGFLKWLEFIEYC